MNALLAVLALALAVTLGSLTPQGPMAVVLCAVVALVAGILVSRIKEDSKFLVRIFVAGLIARVFFGSLIFLFKAQGFFGGDALTYDVIGNQVALFWQGAMGHISYEDAFHGSLVRNWGMSYMVATIYYMVGPNMLATQLVNAVIGAATAPLIYLCASHIFQNRRVARLSALLVAFFPSLVLWSSQGLKDGPIVFLLAVAMLATVRLGERLSVKNVLILLAAMAGVFAFRFYIFYMLVAAAGGAFVIGMRGWSGRSIIRQFGVVVMLGLALTYMGVLRSAGQQMEEYGSLEAVQRSRSYQADIAGSGFGQDVDVSSTSGALSAIPVGMLYLLFAPFPWQLGSLRQSITVPEMVVWWCSFPLLVTGLWFTLRHRMRPALPILIFTTMLTLAYSVFQGNVGTAYRQRSQILIFYFIFVAVGAILVKERQEDNSRRAEEAKRAAIAARADRAAVRRARLRAANARQKDGRPRPLAERVDT